MVYALLPPHLPGQPIFLPHWAGEVHHEVELAIVIGEGKGPRVKRIKEDEALQCVAGYAVAIDLTARDMQQKAKQVPDGRGSDGIVVVVV